MDLDRANPIFVLGIMPRSGTNYLWDLLCLHPHVGKAREPIREDLFLEHSDHLVAYTQAVQEWWDPIWGDFPPDLDARLLASLGDGLISFLWVDRERRLITKSPSVKNVHRFFELFPGARLVILVRDGRAVVESSMLTFGWDFDTAVRRWRTGADAIRSFEEGHKRQPARYRIIRYEDLMENLRETLYPLLDWLDLDGRALDFDAAFRLPVRGSSVFHGTDRDTVHWDPVAKDDSFDPTSRWRDWTPRMHERFAWIAGNELEYLGYKPSPRVAGSGRNAAVQRLLDWRWWGTRTARRVIFLLRVHLGGMSRPLREKLGLVREP
jgi:protein-tyrosine sulfotransferase